MVRSMALLSITVAVFGDALAAAPAEVVSVADADVPTVVVRAAGGGSVAVPACRGVVWQRFDPGASAYTPISIRPCEAMAPAIVVTEEGRRFTVDAPVRDGDVVRAVVVVGSGCSAGQAFELAACASVVSVEGPTITVRGGGD